MKFSNYLPSVTVYFLIFLHLVSSKTKKRPKKVLDTLIFPCGNYCHSRTIYPLIQRIKNLEKGLTIDEKKISKVRDKAIAAETAANSESMLAYANAKFGGGNINVPVHVPAPIVHEVHDVHDVHGDHHDVHHDDDVHLDAAVLNVGQRVANLEHQLKGMSTSNVQMPPGA